MGFIVFVLSVIGWLSFFPVGGALLLPVVQQLDVLPHTFDTGRNLLDSFQLLSCFGDLVGQFILFLVESLISTAGLKAIWYSSTIWRMEGIRWVRRM